MEKTYFRAFKCVAVQCFVAGTIIGAIVFGTTVYYVLDRHQHKDVITFSSNEDVTPLPKYRRTKDWEIDDIASTITFITEADGGKGHIVSKITVKGGYLHCVKTKLGREYTGKINKTETGLIFQRWNTDNPHEHDYLTQWYFDLLADPSMNHNYCRNPDGSPYGPWCYTMNLKIRWDYCNIPQCF